MDKHGWVPIGTVEPLEIGGIDIEDDPNALAPVGTKYVVIGTLTEAEAHELAKLLDGHVQERYRHFYKAIVE
jgi:phosphoribosylformimino-5-aminoimidazole carboxamide ribonucleotide (ProFAR) isomerase